METKDIILDLRTKKGLSQDELAELVFVTRQAVSRWENGETIPNTETLKQLSKLFAVSINTLLGSPHLRMFLESIDGYGCDGIAGFINDVYTSITRHSGVFVQTEVSVNFLKSGCGMEESRKLRCSQLFICF